MGRTPDEIIQEIERERSHLDEDLTALERRVRREVGTRGRSVLVILGVAVAGVLAIGFLLGRAFRS